MAKTNPGNIVRIRSRNGGRASVYEANAWAQQHSMGLYSGNGVLQNTSADMNVLVGGTPSSPDVVIGQLPSGYKIALDLIGQQAIRITAPASNSRIASVVVYSDDISLASTDTTVTGSPSSCGLIVVYGAPSASPTPPSDSDIRTAITADSAAGSQAVYGVIADIKVDSNTSNITSTLITLRKAQLTSQSINSTTSLIGGEIGYQEFPFNITPNTTRGSSGFGETTINVAGLNAKKIVGIFFYGGSNHMLYGTSSAQPVSTSSISVYGFRIAGTFSSAISAVAGVLYVKNP